MICQRVRLAWALCAGVCALLVGCGGSGGPPTYKTTGRVVENGQPVAIQNYRSDYNCLQVDFYPVDEGGNPKIAPHYAAYTAEDGSFSIAGEKGKGITTGKYRVAVRRVDRMKSAKPDPGGNYDAWDGKYGQKTSPFLVDVTGSQGEITIDLAKAPTSASAQAAEGPKPKP